MMTFELTGVEELVESLEKAVKYYPDECRRTLKKTGNKFKKHATKIVKASVKSSDNLTKGFSVSPVKGLGKNMYVEFLGENKKNKHFHLIENGHELKIPYKYKGKDRKDGGKIKGFVPGKHNMPKARDSFQTTFIDSLNSMADRILKEAGLM